MDRDILIQAISSSYQKLPTVDFLLLLWHGAHVSDSYTILSAL